MFVRLTGGLMLVGVAALVCSLVGCGDQGKKAEPAAKAKAKETVVAKADGKKELKEDAKHDEWWCAEHGVPEEICSICMSEAAAKKMFKDKGDWCELHDRAKSQCFKCDPAKFQKYEDMYVAKYGKKPERPPEDEFKK
jgi:hypothetical protein